MPNKFDRKIENTGLDDDGIKQYFQQYFKNHQTGKSDKLQEFLDQNATIKGIYKIPVNIAMLCYIWSETEDGQDLQISAISDLYHQVVDKLGFRYFSNSEKYLEDDQFKEIRSIVDEFNVLSNERWLLYVLTDTNSKNNTWILEQRTSLGDHLIYKIVGQGGVTQVINSSDVGKI